MQSRFPTLALPFQPPFAPMESRPVDALPTGAGWLYEPKWDGFRCLAFRDGRTVVLQGKNGEPITRFFPELVYAISSIPVDRFVLDGEVVVIGAEGLRYDDLADRMHPSARRVAQLSARAPATLMAFDLLALGDDSFVEEPLKQRRARLEAFCAKADVIGVRLSPATTRKAVAEAWLKDLAGAGLDGVVAKRLDRAYRGGLRDAMVKLKPKKTADCVVAGVRRDERGAVTTLLLGLHDAAGLLHYVGAATDLPEPVREKLDKLVHPLVPQPGEPAGFSGRKPAGESPGGAAFQPLRPSVVCEVEYQYYGGERFRAPPSFVRFRPDKKPAQCTFDSLRGVKSKRRVDVLDRLGL